MAINIKTIAGDDLDDVFLPLEGTKMGDVQIDFNGTDISNRYEPIGDGTKIGNTGIQSGGTDISNYFRDINEALLTVTLSGEGIVHTNLGGVATAGLRVNTDGTLDKRVGTSYFQIDSATDWIIPNNAAETDYEFRVTSVTGDGFSSSPGSDGTWFDLTGGALEWAQVTNGQDETTNFVLEVRKNGGATLDTGNYSLSATSNDN